MEGKLVDLHAINPAMPVNLFIAVTSRDTASNAGFDTPAKRALVKQGLMQFYESDSRTWTIFIDTDGDRAFTHRTKMGLMLARCIAVPTDVNDNDARRMEYFSQGIQEMQEAGVWLVGTDDEAEKSIYDLDLTGPIAIVMGAEGEGMRRLTKETCDELVRIPMQGVVESLNVSVASGVCLYEALRQRLLKAAK
jgi:tRNA(Leu) C34 or U34 (ribose-2'-O)-methylase TrmL